MYGSAHEVQYHTRCQKPQIGKQYLEALRGHGQAEPITIEHGKSAKKVDTQCIVTTLYTF